MVVGSHVLVLSRYNDQITLAVPSPTLAGCRYNCDNLVFLFLNHFSLPCGSEDELQA